MNTFTLVVNGQPLEFIDTRDSSDETIAAWDAQQVSDYKTRAGKSVGRCGFGGYDNDAVYFVSTRTIANMVHRYFQQGN